MAIEGSRHGPSNSENSDLQSRLLQRSGAQDIETTPIRNSSMLFSPIQSHASRLEHSSYL